LSAQYAKNYTLPETLLPCGCQICHLAKNGLFDVGLLRPFVFYNRLAIGQKDRLTSQP